MLIQEFPDPQSELEGRSSINGLGGITEYLDTLTGIMSGFAFDGVTASL